MDYSYNWSNMRDPAVDALIDAVYAASSWDEFVAACRALDRVLMWNFYFVPSSAKTEQAMVHWDKFGRPENQAPLNRQPQVPTWWYDEEKAQSHDSTRLSVIVRIGFHTCCTRDPVGHVKKSYDT